MPFVRRSGRDAFLIIDEVEYPIYNWIFSASQLYIPYRTAASGLYPVRTSGVMSQTVTIIGVANSTNIPDFSDIYNTISFYIGWNREDSLIRDAILFHGMLVQYQVNFNYSSTTSPSFTWVATFIAINPPEFGTKQFAFEDKTLCARQPCVNLITTTDTDLYSGFVKNVVSASINYDYLRPEYRVASSAGYPYAISAVKDVTVEMMIQSDFDYWLSKTADPLQSPYTYRFHYGSGISDYYETPQMKVTDILNLTASAQTGQISSANIRLAITGG